MPLVRTTEQYRGIIVLSVEAGLARTGGNACPPAFSHELALQRIFILFRGFKSDMTFQGHRDAPAKSSCQWACRAHLSHPISDSGTWQLGLFVTYISAPVRRALGRTIRVGHQSLYTQRDGLYTNLGKIMYLASAQGRHKHTGVKSKHQICRRHVTD